MANKGQLGPLKRQARQDGWSEWIKSEADEQAVLAGYRWHPVAANKILAFFPTYLCHSIGQWAGQPFRLLRWQSEDVLSPAFGWVLRDNPKLRRFHMIYCEVAKKNGKSTLAAGVGNYLFRGDAEPGAHVFSAATKKEQAALVHDEAVRMIRKSPKLQQGVRINQTTKTASHMPTASKYAVIAKDAKGEEGKNIHGLIGDEMHVWTDRAYWESLRYGGAARRNWMFFLITTAGVYDPSSIAWELHQYAEDILSGAIIDIETFAYIRAADKEVTDTDAILDPQQHEKANPSYRDIIRPEEIAKAAQDAKNKPSERLPFCRYRLNVWTHQSEGFFDVARWKECIDAIDEIEFYGREVYGGLDLASKRDLAAWVLLLPPTEDDEKWRVLTRAFVPEATAELRQAKRGTPYKTWGEQGYLILTTGNTIHYAAILDRMLEDHSRFEVKSIGADPWMLDFFNQQLVEHGIVATPVQQTLHYMSEPTKRLEELYVSDQLRHDGNPVLEWCVRNTVPYEDGKDNKMPHKGKSKDRIDLVTAIVLALAMAMLEQPTAAPSIDFV